MKILALALFACIAATPAMAAPKCPILNGTLKAAGNGVDGLDPTFTFSTEALGAANLYKINDLSFISDGLTYDTELNGSEAKVKSVCKSGALLIEAKSEEAVQQIKFEKLSENAVRISISIKSGSDSRRVVALYTK